LRGALNPERGMLIRHYIVLIVRIDGLVLRRDIDFFGRQFDTSEVLEQISVVGRVQMDVSEAGIARLS